MRKEKITNQKEVGTFCQQYGVEPIRAPSTQVKRRNKQNQKSHAYKKTYKAPYKRNQDRQPTKPPRKPKYTKLKKKDNACWKCGRIGHWVGFEIR